MASPVLTVERISWNMCVDDISQSFVDIIRNRLLRISVVRRVVKEAVPPALLNFEVSLFQLKYYFLSL